MVGTLQPVSDKALLSCSNVLLPRPELLGKVHHGCPLKMILSLPLLQFVSVCKSKAYQTIQQDLPTWVCL